MKKFIRILARAFLVLLMLIFVLWILIQTPFFQDFLGHTVAKRLGKSLETTVKIDHVGIRLFNTLNLEGVYVEDRNKDTLLTAGLMQVRITDWFFAHDSADLKYVNLEDVSANIYRNDSIWNYKFIVDFFSGGSSSGKGGIALHLKVVDLKNIRIRQSDRWRGKYMEASLEKLHLEANQISFKKSIFDIGNLIVEKPVYREFKRAGLWSAADSIAYWARTDTLPPRPDSIPKEINPKGTIFVIRNLAINNGTLEFFNRQRLPSEPGVFDSRDILVTDLTGRLEDVSLLEDTLLARVDLRAKERSGIDLKRLKTNLRVNPQLIELADLDLEMNNSRLGNYYAMHFRSLDDMDEFIDKVTINADFKNSTVSIKDIGFFAPVLKDKNQVVQVTGRAVGTVADFNIDGLDLRTGASRISGTYSMKGLIDIEKTNIEFTTAGSQVALNDVAVWAPEVLSLKNTPVGQLGTVTYTGTFKGTVYDFRAKGLIQSDVGRMDADFKLKMSGKGKGYEGTISKASFDAGKLFNVPQLGDIEFDGTVQSNGFSASDPLNITGTISKANYAGYTYQYIAADAVYNDNKLTATLALSDQNLAGNFETTLDLTQNNRKYNGRGILLRANLRALGFMKDSVEFSGEFDVDFRGKTIDDFLGYAKFYNAKFFLGVKPLSFDSLILRSDIDTTGYKTLSLQTNEADATINGRFNISDLGNSFQLFLHRYYPSIIPAPKKIARDQELTFGIQTREVEPFMVLFDDKLRGFNYSNLAGSLNTNESKFLLNADVPSFRYGNVQFSSGVLNGVGNADTLTLSAGFASLYVNDSLNFPNLELKLNTISDTTNLLLNTSTTGPLGDAKLDAVVYSSSDGFEVNFNESSFIVNNKKWTINDNGNLSVHDGYLTSQGITLQQQQQLIKVFTQPNSEGNWNDIHLDIQNLNTGDLLPYLVKEPRIEGQASGSVIVLDPLGKPHVNMDLTMKEFRFNDDSIGTVALKGDYYNATKKLTATIGSVNEDYDFNGTVNLDLNDSAQVQINTVMPINNMRVNVLKKYLTSILDDVDGYASGNLQLKGRLSNPDITGDVKLRDASLTVGYTKVTYKVDSATLHFDRNYIDFGSMKLKDSENRPGVLEGRMYHRFFDSLSFNLHMRTDGMEVLNTSGKDNELFFGKAIAAATFDLTGPLYNMDIRMTATPTDSSHIYISNKTTRETGNADFVVFKTYGTEMEAVIDPDVANFSMDIDLNANLLCNVDVILDEVTQDIIKAVGVGNLKIHTGTTDPTTMRGRYQIQQGSYNYTFQTLIRKPFILSPDDENYIEWSGDPEDANLHINARYTATRVSMSTLVGGGGTNTPLDVDARNASGDIIVIAKINGRLSNPQIDFDIDFAPGSLLRNNLSAQDMLRRIREDNTEKLRQVTYLIVFKSFAPYKEGTNLRNPGTDLAVNTISDIVSREMAKILTNVVQQITGDQSLNIDFNTSFYNSSDRVTGTTSSAQYDRVNLGVSLNKSYFNNRIVVNVGSDFDLSVRNTTANSFQFLPDISVEFILTANRRLRAILFKRDNLDIGGRRNRAGASISYRKDFQKLFGKKSEDVLIVMPGGKED